MPKSLPLHQRYLREFWPAMAAYIAVMVLLWPLLPQVHGELLKIVLASVPFVPLLFVVRAMVRLALGGDELERRLHLIGLTIAATVVSMLSLTSGFLAVADIINLDGTSLIWVWPTLILVYSAGCGWASHRYGAGRRDGLCDESMAWYWRVLLASLVLAVFAVIIGFGRHYQMSGNELGLLCGMWGTSAGLGSWGLILAIAHWRRRQRPLSIDTDIGGLP